jgi:hypothetical protein
MPNISRKALIDLINGEITKVRFGLMAEPDNDEPLKAEFTLLQRLRKIVESIPSTESEGEADQYDLQMTAELGRLARKHGQLWAALELIKRNELFEHMRKTSTWKIANEALSSHREDAETDMKCPRCGSFADRESGGNVECSNDDCSWGIDGIKDGRDTDGN